MIEEIIDFAIRRRWIVVTLGAITAAFGAFALTKLPIDAVPDITNKQVQINTIAPALSPAEIEKQITFPIETALAGAPGLESTRSLSRNGFSQVTAIFTERTDIYFARQQIGERLTEIRARLPQDIEPRIGPISTGLGEIYMWTVHFANRMAERDGMPGLQRDGRFLTPDGQMLESDIEKNAYLRTVQDWIVRPQIKLVAGVAGVDAIGGYLKQYQVNPDAAKLIALGLTFADVAKAIEANNVSRGARYIERNGEGIVVRSGGRLENIEELGSVVVTTRGGVPVRVRDLATVSIGGETRTGSASENGREIVVGTALMLIGANSRTVSSAVDAKLRAIAPTLPPGVEVTTVLDRTQLVDATTGTVAKNLTEGALLVIAVLFLLLGNLRTALITALVIPLSMLMTAIGMWQGRISANLMSLGALDFGLIVDGAVIITENSLRHLAEKQRELGRLLTREERLATVRASGQTQSVWAGDHPAGLCAAPLVHGRRRQNVRADGVDGNPRARRRFRAVADARSRADCHQPVWTRAGEREPLRRGDEASLSPAAALLHDFVTPRHRWGGRAVRHRPAGLRQARPGVHPVARRKEHRHARDPHPLGGAHPIAGDAARGGEDGQPISAGRLRVLQDRHCGPGGRSDAAECVRHLYHPEAARCMARSFGNQRGFDR